MIDTDLTLPATKLPRSFVPLRENPLEAELTNDAKRKELVHNGWSALDDVTRPFLRQVEENVRMMVGQHWTVYHPTLGSWLDVSSWLSDDEKRWRQRPVINKLVPWYIITHARMTENPPILTFIPGPDRIDSELAEVMDIAQKTLWRELGMVDVHDQLFAWVVVAGRGYLQTRIDMNKGPMRKWLVDVADVPLVDQFGQPIINPETGQPATETVEGEELPIDANGAVLAQIGPEGLKITGAPHSERAGTLQVDVLSPLNVRGSWGPEPWYKKAVHMTKVYMTPEEFFEAHGFELEPDLRGDEASEVQEIDRLLYGSGFYNAASARTIDQSAVTNKKELVEVTTRIQRPCHYGGMEETESSPGGRLTVATRNSVVYDGPRPAKYPYTSPIHAFDFIRLPGRPQGSTPQEGMNPIVRYNNSLYAREMEHINLLSNPKGVVDSATGLLAKDITNEPGTFHSVPRRPGVPAMEFVQPPRLGAEVFQLHGQLNEDLIELGNLRGTEGETPSPSASGELVKELRFNTDRFLGPTMRRTVEEYGRLIETWQSLLPLVWDQETILNYAGEDNVARTISVMPYMFAEGKVNVVADVESMLPEGRGERQSRSFAMYQAGLLGGPPGSPEAVKRFWEVAHFPHLGRLAKPGGVDRITAEQENGILAQGGDPGGLPVYEWYDHGVHLMVHESFMKSPEFRKADPMVQDGFARHRMMHMIALQQMQMQAMAAEVDQAAAMNEATGGGPGMKKGRKSDAPREAPPLAPGSPSPPRGMTENMMPTALPSAGLPA